MLYLCYHYQNKKAVCEEEKCLYILTCLKILFTDFSYARYYGDSYLEFQGLHLNMQNFIHLEFKTYDPHGLLLNIEQSPETIQQFLIRLVINNGTLQVRHQNLPLKESK